MKLRLEADCDVTKTEISEDFSKTDSEDGLGCFGEGATLPFQPNSSEETTCVRRIVLELPDWPRDVLVGGGSASTPDHSTVVERRRDPARKQICLEDNCSCLEREIASKTDAKITCSSSSRNLESSRRFKSSTTTKFEPKSGNICHCDENFSLEFVPFGYITNPSSTNFRLNSHF